VQIDPVTREVIRGKLQEDRQARSDQRAIDSVQIENKVVERLTNLGLQLRDVAGASPAASPASAGSVVGERAYAMQMAKAVGADVVVTGVSRVTRLTPSGLGAASPEGPALRVEVSLRAIRVSDGAILAASSASRDVLDALATQDQAVDDLTGQAVGRLAAGLTDGWAR
jgi:hypothetical protein